MRVLVANQPRSYREAIARVLVQARPHLETITCDPALLAESVRLLAPDLVVCSAVDEELAERAGSWVELYPEGRALARISIHGRLSQVEDPDLAGMLSVVDAVASEPSRRAGSAI